MHRTIIALLVLTIGLLSSTAFATNVRKCSNGAPIPLSVNIDGCEELPCDIVKGTTAIMDVHFVGTKEEIHKLTTKVAATTLGLTVPYELPQEVADVCSNLMYGAMCPIYATEDVVYKFKFYVDLFYPEISVKLDVSLVDEDSERVACFSVDIKVKGGSANPAQYSHIANRIVPHTHSHINSKTAHN